MKHSTCWNIVRFDRHCAWRIAKPLYRVFLFTAIFSSSSLSQAFYPLSVGNIWRYKVFFQGDSINGYGDMEITRDTTVDGRKYYYLPPFGAGYERIDSSLNIYRLDVFNLDSDTSTSEILLDTLATSVGDSWLGYKHGEVTYSVKENQYVTTWFGQNVDVIQISYYTYDSASGGPGLFGGTFHYSSEFGIIYAALEGGASYELRGARINDTVYGILTNINIPIGHNPTDFSVSNPYPNPFNSSVTLEIHLPQQSEASLKIYGVLGNVVRTVWKQSLQAGVHRFHWDLTDDSHQKVPSGVYFFAVTTEQHRVVRKIIAIE